MNRREAIARMIGAAGAVVGLSLPEPMTITDNGTILILPPAEPGREFTITHNGHSFELKGATAIHKDGTITVALV